MANELTTDQYEPEGRLHEAIASFELARDAGQDPKPQEWMGRYPEVASQLADFFADQEHLQQLVGPLRLDASRVVLVPGVEPEPFPEIPGYEILEIIGRGGMGVVYKAWQLSADRIVALKVIRPDRLEGLSPEERRKAVERFITEAQAAAQLEHENIVHVYEVGEVRGRPFYSMRYVEGMSLHDLIQQGPLEGRRSARYLEKVARAVHEAHRHGILHRDLKPDNILVETNGDRPLVADFGLAKLLQGGRDVTGTGDVMGAPSYMSPEQARGSANVTVATDVYGLGATLYALLTGRPPFHGDDAVQTLRKVVEEEPLRPRALNPRVHPDLETICLKCLEKEPRKRYGSAEELADRLRLFLEGKPIPDRPVTGAERLWRWCRRNPILAATGCLAAVAIVAVVAVSISFGIHANRAAEKESKAADDLRGALDDVKTQRRSAEDRLVRVYVSNGVRLMDEGDLLGSLPWFVKALEEEKGGPEREEMHRMRLGAVWQQCPRLLQLWLCEGRVNHAEFSPDGQRVVTASDDGTVQVWDAQTGQSITASLKHNGLVWHAAFSLDGRRVVTGSNDGTARLWDAQSGLPVTAPLKHTGGVHHVAFSPDGRQVVTASFDKTAQVWDAQSGEPATPPLKHNGYVNHAVFSPDGRRVLTASEDGTARVWDAQSGQAVTGPLKHNKGVSDAAFSPDGRRVVTASCAHNSADGEAQVWDAQSGQPVTGPLKHDNGVEHAIFSPDGRRVVTASFDGTARVWDAQSGRPVTVLLKHDPLVLPQAVFSPDGRWVLTASENTVRIWDAQSGRPVTVPLRHNGAVLHAAFSPDGLRVVTATIDHTVRVWDALAGQRIAAPLRHNSLVFHAAFSPDGRRIVTASSDQTAQVWDAQSGQPITRPLKHDGSVKHAVFSPDGRRVVTASEYGTARIWDAQSGEPVAPPLKYDGVICYAVFSPDGQRVFTPSENTVRIWDAESGKPISSPLQHKDLVLHLDFSPDGRRMITASQDRTARVWDSQSGQPVTAPLQHNHSVIHAAFSPDGRRVLTACSDKTARVWDAQSGEPVTPPLKHNGVISHAVFSPDGRCVLTASEDGTARVWDAQSGEPVTPPLTHNGTAAAKQAGTAFLERFFVSYAVFSPDGRRVLTASGDDTARVWDLPWGEQPAGDWRLMAELLTGQRMDPSGGLMVLEPKILAENWQNLRTKYPGDFTVATEEQLVWHDSEAADCARAGEWFAALFHLDQLVKGQPKRGEIHLRRACAHIGLGQPGKAAGDLAKANELKLDDWSLWPKVGVACAEQDNWSQAAAAFQRCLEHDASDVMMKGWHTLALAGASDAAGHRKACAGLLEKFGTTEGADLANNVAWFCIRFADSVTDPARPLALAEKAVATNPKKYESLNTLGAALYRSKRFEDSIEKLNEAMQVQGQGGTPGDWLFLAMAHKRLGHTEDAQKWLTKAQQWLDQRTQEKPKEGTAAGNPLLWDQRLEFKLIRAEAEALLKEDPKK